MPQMGFMGIFPAVHEDPRPVLVTDADVRRLKIQLLDADNEQVSAYDQYRRHIALHAARTSVLCRCDGITIMRWLLAPRSMPARVAAASTAPIGIVLRQSAPQVDPQHLFVGNARPPDHPLAGVNGDGLTDQTSRRRPGPGLHGPDAQGDQRGLGLVQGDGVHQFTGRGVRYAPQGLLPGNGGDWAGASLHLGDDAGGHRGPDDVVAAVVLAGDAVQCLHVDGMRRADGRLQF